MKTKVCTKCGRELPLSEFHKTKTTKDGLKIYCKICRKTMATKNIKHCGIKIRSKVYFKTCSKCGKLKHVDEFARCSYVKSGHISVCKSCDQERGREYYKLPGVKERHKITLQAWRGRTGKTNICKVNFDLPIKFKCCSKCGVVKNISNFAIRNDRKRGLYCSYCKECAGEYTRNYIKNNKELVRSKERIKRKDEADSLNNIYVRGQIRRLKIKNETVYFEIEEIPMELLELKRTIIFIRRELYDRKVNV